MNHITTQQEQQQNHSQNQHEPQIDQSQVKISKKDNRSNNDYEVKPFLENHTKENRTCALLFFGLPKRFRQIIYPSIEKNILNINKNCDVYLHTYNVSHSPRNIRNKEPKAEFNLKDVYILTENVIVNTEKEFLKARNVTYYRQYFPPKNRSWIYPISMDNMIKQWHSIDSVFNYMESTSLSKYNTKQYYDRVGLFRSDQVYLSPINISDGDAVIPEYGWNVPNTEINDRFFYGLYDYAKIWATYRFTSVEDYMHNSPVARITKLHSESILYYIMDKSLPEGTSLETRKMCAKRVRSTGRKENDCWCKDFGKVCNWAKGL